MKDSKQINVKEKTKILDKYAKFVGAKGFYPNLADMLKIGIDRNKIRYYFGTQADLKDEAKKHAPKSFAKVVDESLFTPKQFKALREEAGKYQRFFITTAVVGCSVHKGFYESIQTYCKKNEAALLVLPAADPAAKGGWNMDPILADTLIVFDDLALNDNLFLSSIKLSAKHIDPTTGLSRIGQRNGSFIYASPKQRLKMTPTSNTKLPHAMMTTGALTTSNYQTDSYMSERTAYIAEVDHVLGGIIVEIVDDKLFHFRQVQADRNGHFVDLGDFYRGKKTETLTPSLVLGDWHSGETDPTAKHAFVGATDSVRHVTKPNRIFIHDGFNGRSISHHEIKNRVLRAQRAAQNHLCLEAELREYAADLEALAAPDHVEEVVIVRSNHDEFLHRYLAEARYSEPGDSQNHHIALKLAQAMVEGKNPLEYAVEQFGINNAHKLTWLKRDEDYKIANVELGSHGDKGANGARGSLQAMENAYGNSVSGHSHTPEILRGAWQVGTCSLLKLNYNEGPSSWMHTSCLVYPNGSRQLINVINGEWRLV
jgi:hypothetical protein